MKPPVSWNDLFEVLGWLGTVFILLAYFLVSFGYWSVGTLAFQVLNITGSLGIMAVSWRKKCYPALALNIIWCLIGVGSLVKLLFL